MDIGGSCCLIRDSFPGICLEGQVDTSKSLSQCSKSWGLYLDSRPPAGRYSRVSFFVIDTDKPICIVKRVFGSKNLQNISERL